MLVLYFLFFQDQTIWFRNQLLKYMLPGVALSIFAFVSNLESLQWVEGITTKEFLGQIVKAVNQKAFFVLSVIGAIFVFLKFFNEFSKKGRFLIQNWRIDMVKLRELATCFSIAVFLSFFIDNFLIYGFGVLWPICLLSLVPVEWIFQSLMRIRSKRNLIYGVYILVCLLDSRIEERAKILFRVLD